jgi:hypothetical protein
MSTTTNTTAPATARQRQTIADLTAELGYSDVPEPRSAQHASAIIRRLIEECPASRNPRILARLNWCAERV